ncbi:hypothetical protein J5J83_04750 [Azoarcus sp. L1K30]|uniref:hypothetical protein n=1 Tax=Azoarcus sp. L1K30 TaxID=2820277 RepID=UPI001B827A23|nr:hypothetical protein [Azoarcus sp. L1K30]MBR0565426.1 hypothetical protein [Azoarcus sp. L1K30]
MIGAKPGAVARDWFAKTSAGALLGFTLAIGCSGLFSCLASDMPLSIRGQLAMWMMAPVWIGVLSCVYFFRSGKHAWVWLSAANLVVFCILAACRLT